MLRLVEIVTPFLRYSLTLRFGQVPKLFGLAMTMMALMGQLALGAMSPPDASLQAKASALEAALVLCQTFVPGETPQQSPIHHIDCPLCPLCQAIGHPVVALVPRPPVFDAPQTLVRTRAIGANTARAPPPSLLTPASSRGPPIPV